MLPNLIIIGAMKCATSALHHYLSLHPSIVMSVPKELDFFVEGKNWNKGLDWYESHFDTTSKQAKVYGEASPSYTGFPAIPGVAERMHSVVPDTKLIYLVRHPIERIISHYMHRCAHGEERRSISEALTLSARGAADRSIYILRSKYYMQVAQFLNFFPRSSLFIASQEDLLGRRRDTLAAIFRFLGVDETIDVEEFSRARPRIPCHEAEEPGWNGAGKGSRTRHSSQAPRTHKGSRCPTRARGRHDRGQETSSRRAPLLSAHRIPAGGYRTIPTLHRTTLSRLDRVA